MESNTFVRTNNGAGLVNTDVDAYRRVVAKRKQDKYIRGLELRIQKLESSMQLLQSTIKEIGK
ncbi:hypothetical protein OAG36_00970 [bacterium]|nr:hypothetical protein [bacterium]